MLMDTVFALQKEWRPISWTVERIAGQDYIFKDIREEMFKRSVSCVINSTPKDAAAMSEDAKDKRISGLKNPFYNGEYYLHVSMKELVAEIVGHPSFMSADSLDALSWFNQMYASGKVQGDVADLNKKKLKSWGQAREGSIGY